ncbi:hypothetical protein D3C84_888150 [compost metagenome]
MRALARVIRAITPHTVWACDTSMKQSVVNSRQVAASQLRATLRLPVRRSSRSEILPPSSTVKQAPVHGIMPMYHSDDRL